MTAFVDAHELIFRGTFLLLSAAALLGVVCFAMSTSYRLRPRYVLPEFFAVVGALVFFSCLFDGIRIRDLGESRAAFSRSVCFLPAWSAVLLAAGLSGTVGVCFVLVLRKRRNSLTAMSVKEALAALPTGLCFYDGTGRVLLMNPQMDAECRAMTGQPLSDGAAFFADLCAGNLLPGVVCTRRGESVIAETPDGVTCYKRVKHELDGKTVYELSGADISREYALKNELEEKNRQLRAMNARLRRYGDNVTRVTKERETLAARVKIHDGMGSLLLTTKKALSQGGYDRRALLSMWESTVCAICHPESETQDKFAEATRTAESVGVNIVYTGVRPGKASGAENLLAAAMFECITNTARHADGDELYVQVRADGEVYTAELTNNGKPPAGEIREGGGLSALREAVENAGGRMRVESAPRFRLTVTIPKEEKRHE